MDAQIRRLSPRNVMERLPGVRRPIPARVLVLSVVALLIAIWGALASPAVLAGYDALSWYLILIPAFLFAYYRGWRGATTVIAVGTGLVLGFELLAEHVLDIPVEWVFLFWTSVILLCVGAGVGMLSELLDRERREALAFAYADPVTGLPNKSLLEGVLGVEFGAALAGEPMSVVLLDIDGFGKLNADRGRAFGDDALNAIGGVFESELPELELAGRFNADRFLAILPGYKLDEALALAERVRTVIGGSVRDAGADVGLSAGVAAFEPTMTDPLDLVDAAERAARRAKARGGNQVCATPEHSDKASGSADERELSRSVSGRALSRPIDLRRTPWMSALGVPAAVEPAR